MPDPTGANLTDSEVSRIDKADPLFREFSLADRLQELRTDFESGERNDVLDLGVIAANHTLTAPGEAVSDGANETEITSNLIFCSVAGGTGPFNLVMCDPAKYVGELAIICTSQDSQKLFVKHTKAPGSSNVNSAAGFLCVSDGSDWYIGGLGGIDDLTA